MDGLEAFLWVIKMITGKPDFLQGVIIGCFRMEEFLKYLCVAAIHLF